MFDSDKSHNKSLESPLIDFIIAFIDYIHLFDSVLFNFGLNKDQNHENKP
jgi:hypothetical protein